MIDRLLGDNPRRFLPDRPAGLHVPVEFRERMRRDFEPEPPAPAEPDAGGPVVDLVLLDRPRFEEDLSVAPVPEPGPDDPVIQSEREAVGADRQDFGGPIGVLGGWRQPA